MSPAPLSRATVHSGVPPPPSLVVPGSYPSAPLFPSERRNPSLRYAANRPTDCSGCWARSSASHPPPPSSVHVLSDCSGTFVPAALCYALSSAAPSPGARRGGRCGAAGHCEATPPSSAVGGRNRPSPALLCVAWKKDEKRMLQAYISIVSYVSKVCSKCFGWMLQN
jgi:hypothetical protein